MTPRVSAWADDALGQDDVTALLERLRQRQVSPAELRAAAVERMHRVNPSLNAVVAELAVPASDGGAWQGIPTVLKDNEDLAGWPTLHGSWAPAGRPASATSPWVAQFLGLGVDPIAKTTLPEFGLTASTESSRFGATRNPWDLDHSVGGSSGGSAALVAAGVVPVGHANDGGGSIRIPAACCGLVGLKPSRGRLIDIPELDRLPINLVTQGVVTRSVRDTALYFAEAEKAYAPAHLPPLGLVQPGTVEPLRIAVVVEGLQGLPVDAHAREAVLAAGRLAERMGHLVEEIELPIPDQFGRDFLRYWAFLAFTLERAGGRLFGAGFDGRKTEPLTRGLSAMFRQQAERLPATLRRLRRQAREGVPAPYDVIMTPTLGHAAPPIGWLGPDVDVRTQLVRLLQFSSFTPLQNVTGEPAISLPLGRTPAGLPLGVQCAGRRGQEALLLRLAFAFEEASPWLTVD